MRRLMHLSVYGVLLLWFWITGVLVLTIDDGALPLMTVRFASVEGALWIMAGGLAFGLTLYVLLRSPPPNQQITGFLQTAAGYLNEPIIICTAKGRLYWRNEAARPLLIEGKRQVQIPDAAIPMLKKVHQTKRVAIQALALGEGERYSVQTLPLNRRYYALIFRPLQGDYSRNTFYENFVRRIVHDMRNPLAAIIGHAANLSQSPEADTTAWRKSAGTIENEAQRLARLVDSMLFDARLAYVPLQLERFELADVVEEAFFIHEEQAMRDGKQLEIDTTPERMALEGDRDLLVRAFANLIDNSLKYSGDDGHVAISLENHAHEYRITFQDNGRGIAPQYLPDRIFEPLVRAQSHGSGSGLGLSIVKKIIEMHHGTISAQSKVNEGTTMLITLPKPDSITT